MAKSDVGPLPINSRLCLALFLTVILGGCAYLNNRKLNQKFGTRQPEARHAFSKTAVGISYLDEVRPILANRCVVCHGCYDAPCQLKLTSYEGIERGASQEKVYKSGRLSAAKLTRLFVDADTVGEWREKEFYPVLNERRQSNKSNTEASVLFRMLQLKQENSLPQSPQLPKSFDFKLDRDQECPSIEKFDGFARKHPLWGMPYGLPGILNDFQNDCNLKFRILGLLFVENNFAVCR